MTSPLDPIRSRLAIGRDRAARARRRRSLGVFSRLSALEAEVQENRQLNRRIAELTDVVAELLLPVADRDEERVRQALADYRVRL
ncbi:DUF6752 domain-containing protein [Nocardioides sp. 503]|uniref:DUF6752 domain-containing protein n=1 Tax=Nocardioides sp. 503 TaxID=2508326 RepID=UPI001FD6FF9F|nr:DUF6752 domain-containing protein [Nocardioides sp. 503]